MLYKYILYTAGWYTRAPFSVYEPEASTQANIYVIIYSLLYRYHLLYNTIYLHLYLRFLTYIHSYTGLNIYTFYLHNTILYTVGLSSTSCGTTLTRWWPSETKNILHWVGGGQNYDLLCILYIQHIHILPHINLIYCKVFCYTYILYAIYTIVTICYIYYSYYIKCMHYTLCIYRGGVPQLGSVGVRVEHWHAGHARTRHFPPVHTHIYTTNTIVLHS